MLGRAGGEGTLWETGPQRVPCSLSLVCSRFEIQAEGESRCLTWVVCPPLGLLGERVCSPLDN